jgi:hypothetical protein
VHVCIRMPPTSLPYMSVKLTSEIIHSDTPMFLGYN